MNSGHPINNGLDAAFIDAQRKRLEAMRNQLIKDGDGAATDEQQAQYASIDEVHDSGDQGEVMAIQENDEAVYRSSVNQLGSIERALEKIKQGTYGLSDVSGKPIDRKRLEVVPEAVTTVEEGNAAHH